jgi:hypothetical protein
MGQTRALVEPERVLRDRGLPTVARIGRELDTGHASVGVLTRDFETEAVAEQLKDLGGTPENEGGGVEPQGWMPLVAADAHQNRTTLDTGYAGPLRTGCGSRTSAN